MQFTKAQSQEHELLVRMLGIGGSHTKIGDTRFPSSSNANAARKFLSRELESADSRVFAIEDIAEAAGAASGVLLEHTFADITIALPVDTGGNYVPFQELWFNRNKPQYGPGNSGTLYNYYAIISRNLPNDTRKLKPYAYNYLRRDFPANRDSIIFIRNKRTTLCEKNPTVRLQGKGPNYLIEMAGLYTKIQEPELIVGLNYKFEIAIMDRKPLVTNAELRAGYQEERGSKLLIDRTDEGVYSWRGYRTDKGVEEEMRKVNIPETFRRLMRLITASSVAEKDCRPQTMFPSCIFDHFRSPDVFVYNSYVPE